MLVMGEFMSGSPGISTRCTRREKKVTKDSKRFARYGGEVTYNHPFAARG